MPATVLLGLVALAGAAAPMLVLHLALGHAMRARGLTRWRLTDTLLVSPLLVAGLLVGFGGLGYALDVVGERGAGGGVGGPLVVAGGAFVIAAFGARAVGKLY